MLYGTVGLVRFSGVCSLMFAVFLVVCGEVRQGKGFSLYL